MHAVEVIYVYAEVMCTHIHADFICVDAEVIYMYMLK